MKVETQFKTSFSINGVEYAFVTSAPTFDEALLKLKKDLSDILEDIDKRTK